ncbi:hypothetical protein D3C75_706210 [compost metagenome]
MVSARMDRIIAVVRRQNQQILLADLGHDFRQARIKFHQRSRISLHIPAVAEQGVKIHQIGEHHTLEAAFQHLDGPVDAVLVAFGGIGPGYTLPGVNIIDFAHGNTVQPGFRQPVHHSGSGGFDGIVMPVGGPFKGSRLPHKRAGNNAANRKFRAQSKLPGDLTGLVQLLQRNNLLMGGDLEYAVRRRVYNPGAGLHMLLTQLVQNFRAGRRFITEDAPAGAPGEFLQQFRREAVRVGVERSGNPQAHNLPMACHGVFAYGLLRHFAVIGPGLVHRCNSAERCDIAQSQLRQMRHLEALGMLRDVAQCMGARIPEGRGVRQFADTDAVQHDQCDAFEFLHTLTKPPSPEPAIPVRGCARL